MHKLELMFLDYGLLNRMICDWHFCRQSSAKESPFYR